MKLNNTTAIIISFLRSAYLKKCVNSLREQYPDIKILVGENGKYSKDLEKFCKKNKAEYIDLPFDSGVCYARNELMKRVKTDYVLIGDDDFQYTEDSKIPEMVEFLRDSEFDLIGGRISEGGVVKNYQGFIELYDDHFEYESLNLQEPFKMENGLRYAKVDITFNFFVAKTDRVRDIHWDNKIKVAYEHSAWFIDLKKKGKKVAFSPDPIVIHKPSINEKYPDYINYRSRKEDKERFFDRFDIAYTIDMYGRYDYGHGRENIRCVDFLITTFIRKDCLEDLLFSIAKYYPEANIYIADQNKKFDKEYYINLWQKLFDEGLQKKPKAFNLEYDCGLSYARNFLVENTPNIYKLILDDDFVFNKDTKIEKFVDILQNDHKVGIVGGLVLQAGQEVHFEHHLKRKGQILYHLKDKDKYLKDKNYKYTGCVLNFALMRRDIFDYVKWDNDFKVAEHSDFYIRFPHDKFKVAYTPDVKIDHQVAKDENYKEYRDRQEFMVNLFKKHNLKKIKYINGQVFELEGEGIKSYKNKLL